MQPPPSPAPSLAPTFPQQTDQPHPMTSALPALNFPRPAPEGLNAAPQQHLHLSAEHLPNRDFLPTLPLPRNLRLHPLGTLQLARSALLPCKNAPHHSLVLESEHLHCTAQHVLVRSIPHNPHSVQPKLTNPLLTGSRNNSPSPPAAAAPTSSPTPSSKSSPS